MLSCPFHLSSVQCTQLSALSAHTWQLRSSAHNPLSSSPFLLACFPCSPPFLPPFLPPSPAPSIGEAGGIPTLFLTPNNESPKSTPEMLFAIGRGGPGPISSHRRCALIPFFSTLRPSFSPHPVFPSLALASPSLASTIPPASRLSISASKPASRPKYWCGAMLGLRLPHCRRIDDLVVCCFLRSCAVVYTASWFRLAWRGPGEVDALRLVEWIGVGTGVEDCAGNAV